MIGRKHHQDRIIKIGSGTNFFDFPSSKMKTLLDIAPLGSFERSDLIKITSIFLVKSNAPQKDIKLSITLPLIGYLISF